MSFVDDSYMVRIEAINTLWDMQADFKKLTEAYMPKDELPSLRDLMAIHAMASLLVNCDCKELMQNHLSKNCVVDKIVASTAYTVADAMLKAREK